MNYDPMRYRHLSPSLALSLLYHQLAHTPFWRVWRRYKLRKTIKQIRKQNGI